VTLPNAGTDEDRRFKWRITVIFGRFPTYLARSSHETS